MRTEAKSIFNSIRKPLPQDNNKRKLFCYHGDHLAQASQSTAPSHALTSQRNNFDYTSTTFSTGFGARYYDSDISVWLSVDPLSDMYPSMSAYMYVRGNPIMLIDRWGLEGGKPDKIKIRKVRSDRADQSKFRFRNKTTGERGWIYTPEGKTTKDVKNDHKNGNFKNYDILTYNKDGSIKSEKNYNSNGELMTMPIVDLSGVEIISKRSPAQKQRAMGRTYVSHDDVINSIINRPDLWPGIVASLITLGLQPHVGSAVTSTCIYMDVKNEEYNKGLIEMANYYIKNKENEGIFIEVRTSISVHSATEVVNFYSGKSGLLIGTSRIHHAL